MKTKKEIIIESPERVRDAAGEFIDYISHSDLESNIFAFYAPMGAGQTTFIRRLCACLGVKDDVNSPTFTIVNEYRAAQGFPIYHFDFYRITKISEAYDIGIEEYFASDGLSLIEWPERVEELLPPEVIKVTITPQPDGTRKMVIGAEIEGL